ncbi:MAG: hypothetical protein J6S58_09235, partial [Lentisphaeria bacterium]|nr:hypothetical protein [Lentisphaeria bacterium]
ALTNHPAMHGIPALVADDLTVSAEENTVLQKEEPHSMTNEPTLSGKDRYMNEILLKLGLESFSSENEEQRNLALEKRVSGLLLQEEQLRAFLAKRNFADLDRAEEALRNAELLQSNERLRQAFSQGKLCESMRSWAERFASEDPAGFDLWVQEAPRIVPDNSQTEPENMHTSAYGDLECDPEQKRILHLLGLVREDGKKLNSEENKQERK